MTQTDTSVEVTLNGEALTLFNILLPDVLCELGYDPEQQGIAVAINMSVVPRSEWTETSIADGDRIDIVGAKQGG
ncbi:MAG: sulfur carrier protein ThiS [Chloroflexi bacterium]|nr:sulfur carrier protein ThiS [Chloroflexota bacterium]